MDSSVRWIVPLANAADVDKQIIGGKAAALGQLSRSGFRIPAGFCLTVSAYERFVEEGQLAKVLRMELGRKPFSSLRWEEIWDAALRIRSAFLATPIPTAVSQAVCSALETLGHDTALVVRSSAPGEDSARKSFAGLHESVVGVVGATAVLDAVRRVWASLWSDAALLYRQELSLDPAHSRMAVVLQRMVDEQCSGVAFARDPRDLPRDRAIIEAVPGQCRDLVDGLVDPDRWILRRTSAEVLEWRPGNRVPGADQALVAPVTPLLETDELRALLQTLLRVESLFGWPPDVEWTGRQERFTLLQARPITTGVVDPTDTRAWYLTLRPGRRRLKVLAQRVMEELIPSLEDQGKRFAAEVLERYDDATLAAAIEERFAALQHWRQIYWDEFIPFAHGARQLGLYYNDAVRPRDPYEFVGLLKGQPLVASQRNLALENLAAVVKDNPALHTMLRHIDASSTGGDDARWREALRHVETTPGGERFSREFTSLLSSFMDVAYENERLTDHPELLLRTVLEMARERNLPSHPTDALTDVLEQRLLAAVGEERREEAREILAIGRLSWRLRDDDNVLLGRLESQLLRALRIAADRLGAAGRLPDGGRYGEKVSPLFASALRNPSGGLVVLPPEHKTDHSSQHTSAGEKPRQLVGQPAAPGLATGRVRRIQSTADLGRFRAGDVLVCDAIQPTMTHLVPLACAVVERRGGMLIHGAIIARELGIPCVNGIAHVTDLLPDDEVVTVDGYLGIVSVGAPDFALEAK